jgi:hypothetical protein
MSNMKAAHTKTRGKKNPVEVADPRIPHMRNDNTMANKRLNAQEIPAQKGQPVLGGKHGTAVKEKIPGVPKDVQEEVKQVRALSVYAYRTPAVALLPRCRPKIYKIST